MTDLLDADVLIALCVAGDVRREAALAWVRERGRFAVCPITEGALVRHLFRLTLGDRAVVRTTLAKLRRFDGYEFWAADLSYSSVPLDRLQGHKQVTDAYLVALAAAHGGRLATFDRALAAVHLEAIVVPSALQ